MRKSAIVVFASAAILLAAIIIAFVRADDRNQATVSSAETANHSSKHSNPPEQSSKTGAVTEAGLDETNNVPTPVQAASTPLSEEEALAIAKRELGDYGYDHDAPIVVRRGPDYFDFIFPEPHHGPPDDDDYYGADFAARVRIDSRTGAVVEIEAGG